MNEESVVDDPAESSEPKGHSRGLSMNRICKMGHKIIGLSWYCRECTQTPKRTHIFEGVDINIWKKYPCVKCKISFANKDRLQAHEKSGKCGLPRKMPVQKIVEKEKTPPVKRHECERCGKPFQYACLLKRHLNSNCCQNNRCYKCRQYMTSSYELKKHLKPLCSHLEHTSSNCSVSLDGFCYENCNEINNSLKRQLPLIISRAKSKPRTPPIVQRYGVTSGTSSELSSVAATNNVLTSSSKLSFVQDQNFQPVQTLKSEGSPACMAGSTTLDAGKVEGSSMKPILQEVLCANLRDDGSVFVPLRKSTRVFEEILPDRHVVDRFPEVKVKEECELEKTSLDNDQLKTPVQMPMNIKVELPN